MKIKTKIFELENHLKLETAVCNLEEFSWVVSTILVDKLVSLPGEQIRLKSQNDYPNEDIIKI